MLSNVNDRNLKTDRVLVLKVKEGESAISSTGLIDKRLFTRENNLHAIKDPQTCMWYMKYDEGSLPPVLRNQRFTKFSALKKYAEDYFKTRNVEITEVID